MKFTVNMECSPEEARTFFGLPDVQPMQQALMKEVQERMMQGMKNMEPDALMQQWLPMSMKAFDQFQNMFWSSMQNTGTTPAKK
ncbi:MAG: hypothetical protein EB059_08375 [Alphaproteobacteria bacterium]|nr:hypothetical protein [Alphaproteobacteria bacterium]